MGMSFDRYELISDVMRMITGMQELGVDPLDTVEFVVGLEEQFGTGVVQQAISLLERKKKRGRSRPMGGEPDPLWDRELDG
jgi:hypothetical protein